MIKIDINPAQFAYDVQSLVQAFYPGHPFKVNQDVSSFYRELKINYEENQIVIVLKDESKILFEEQIDWKPKSFEGEYRKQTKNILKKYLYNILSKDTNTTLPWGNLTGIRPAKIVVKLLEQGLSESEICNKMKETYLISDEKLALAMEVAKGENRLLKDIHYKDGYSLYIGIPFCPTTCLYCSFTSFPIKRYEDKVEQYVDALILELKFLGEKLRDRELDTIYIGGGTPTTLQPNQLKRLIEAVNQYFDCSTVKEFTVEAGRPDSITKEKLMVLKDCGVTRISINPQTMNQETLDFIGRKHTVLQVKEAFYLARECGFDNINMDFIIGLPGEDEGQIYHSMEEMLKLDPESLTIHSFAVKRASRFSMNYGKYADLTIENNNHFMDITRAYATNLGMKPYYLYRQKNMAGNQENIGYAKAGYECLYNVLMMGDYQDVWAVGAGAVTKVFDDNCSEATRIDTLKNVDMYIERIDEMIERKNAYFTTSLKI